MAEIPLNVARHCTSAITLANAAELTSSIIKEIAGNDISNSLNGNTLTKEIIQTIALQRINQKLGATNA